MIRFLPESRINDKVWCLILAKFKPNRITVIFLAVVLSLGLAVWSLIPGSYVNRLLGPAAAVLVPIQKAAGDVRDRVGDIFNSFQSGLEIQAENEKLKEELAELKQTIKKLEGENLKYQELREALKIQETYDHYDVLHANVISQPFGTWFDVFRIDIGADDGLVITDDQLSFPVVDSEMNLVGRILMADDYSSTVLPFINEGSVVSAKINRTDGAVVRVFGDISLKGTSLVMVDNVPENANLKIGDELITSGNGGFYPLGLPIGRISRIYEEEGHIRAELEPYAEYIGLTDVFVLKGQTNR